MAKPMLVIESPDGAQYATTEKDYKATYADEGFKVIGYEDGTPYENGGGSAGSDEDEAPKRGRAASKE
jgi:hypothetical protein